MAHEKLTDRNELTTAADGDKMHIVDVSDNGTDSAGNSKFITVTNLMGKAPVQSVNGDTGTVVLEVNDLDDVNAGSPSDNDVLSYDNATSKYIADGRLTTLYNEFRTGTTTDVQNGASTDSKLELTATTAKMKTGVTEVKLTETSPGEIDFVVAAGASGSETPFTAVEINGTTTANNALFDVKTGTRLRIESGTNDLATLRNQASADTVIDLPTSTGTLALTSQLYTDADADGQIAAASVTDLSDVTSAGSGAIITSAERTKLSGIEASADVTDTANVTAAGALMDSEVTNLAQVKAFDSSDYATAAQGTTADSALQDVVDDTTPQLGGDLDVNGNKITSTSNGDIDIEPNGTGDVLLGNFKFDADQTVGSGQDNYVLTYDNSTGKISLEAASGGGGGGATIDPLPSDQAKWAGNYTSGTYPRPSVTQGWIPWSTMKTYFDVELNENSNVNSDKEYIVPSDGFYEYNAFMAVREYNSSDAEYKIITGLNVNGTDGEILTSRTTTTVPSGQYDGTGGTCVIELSQGDVVQPQFYLYRTSGSGAAEIINSAAYLHCAIRKIYDSSTGSAAGIGDLSDVPSTMGTSGQVLAVNSAGTALEYVNQSGGGSSMWSTNFNGRFEFTTSETGANKWVYGGGYYGVNYYNWTNSHTETLGTDPPTVGTTTFTVAEYNLARYGLVCQKAGTLKVKALINWDTVTGGAAGETMDWLVINVPSTNMDGTYNGNVEAGICAYGSVTCPSSNANISPSNISITGGSVSAGDVLVLFCRWEDATFTTTQRMTVNVSYIVE